MSTALQERPQRATRTAEHAPERSVSDIINRARTAPAPALGGLGVTLATSLLLWTAFYPLNWGPLGWIAPIPLLLLCRVNQPTRWMYPCLWLGGAGFWVPTLQWMRLGDVSMIPAWLALACYLACYFPAMIACMRLAVLRLHIPLTVAAPVVWVAGEYLRAHLLTGFAWYLLGHSQYEFTSLVQISDLFGAYGVSFLMLLSAAALAECLPGSWCARLRIVPPVCDVAQAVRTASLRERMIAVLTSVLLTSAAALYGSYRIEQGTFTTGPRVALVQGDFQPQVKHEPGISEKIYHTHFQMTGLAVKHRPDVILWPETMFPYALLLADPEMTPQQLAEQYPQVNPTYWRDDRANVNLALRDRAEQAGAPLIVGLVTFEARPSGRTQYNSAVVVEPQQGITGRYDKLHLVPFGEYLPLKSWLPFLKHFSPYGEMSLSPGEHVQVFRLGEWRLLPLICFEDTVPHLVRAMTRIAETPTGETPDPRPIDCLVNLTNDGWFRDSSEQEQHLVTAAFRCIETRAPMVRAVNCGISAVIDGNGIVRDPAAFIDYDRLSNPDADRTAPVRNTLRNPATGRYYKALNAVQIVDVPLDARGSLYLWWGDWLAAGCLVLTLTATGYATLLRRTPQSAAALSERNPI